jgi:hypothetical protein
MQPWIWSWTVASAQALPLKLNLLRAMSMTQSIWLKCRRRHAANRRDGRESARSNFFMVIWYLIANFPEGY